MIAAFIKFYFVFIFTTYSTFKLLKIELPSFKSHIFINLYNIFLVLISLILKLFLPEAVYIIPLLLLWLLISNYSQPIISFTTTTFSFSINYALHIICSLITMIFIHPLRITNENLRYSILALATAFLQLFVITKFLSCKRLRKGLTLTPANFIQPATTCTALFLLAFITYIPSERYNFYLQASVIVILLLTLAFLIYWWQAQIKKAYLRKLEIQELESTRTAMAELKLLNKQLVEDNTRLSRISHRDNTLITALKNTATHLLSTLDPESAEAIAAGELLRNLETLSAERAPVASASEANAARHYETGFSLFDTLLNEMSVYALRNEIAFSVHFGIGLDLFIPKDISESDFVHMVDDLLKNAFKSTLTKENRAVQLQFYKTDKYFVVEVADSGISFEVESLVNMGFERRTTYADGSGIGLMDIWNTKENYRATYHLEEYRNPDPFTKCIFIAFDKKNRYSIRTYRKADILQQVRRADLQVYSDTE